MARAFEIPVQLAGFHGRGEEASQSARDRTENHLLRQGRHGHPQGQLAINFRSQRPRQKRYSSQPPQCGRCLAKADPKEFFGKSLDADQRNLAENQRSVVHKKKRPAAAPVPHQARFFRYQSNAASSPCSTRCVGA